MPNDVPDEATAALDTAGRTAGDEHLARESLGTGAIAFMVLAFAAPVSVVVGTMPLGIGFGNGVGMPGAFLVAALVLLCFVAGYVAMSRHVVNAGAFYAYITRGLGRWAGGAAALIAVVSYTCLTIALCVAFGYYANLVIASLFSIHVAWWIWALAAVAIAGALGYLSVEVSGKVLGVALVLELLIIAALDIGTLVDRGPSAFPMSSFAPSTVFSGLVGVAFVYAFLSFIGIEATAIFGEEARDPARTVPRAGYIAVTLIGIVYVLTCWSLVAAYGADHVQAAAAQTPALFSFGASAMILGSFLTDVMQVLLLTSLLAVVLAAHNASARYMFSLGRARLVPLVFARSHPRWQSPYGGSVLVTAVSLVAVVATAIVGGSPNLGFVAPVLALGTVGIVLLQAVASVSIFVFFRRLGDQRLWTTWLAPLLAAGGLGTALVLILENYGMVTGSQSGLANKLPWVFVLAGVVGVVSTLRLRARKPEAYTTLGAAEHV